MRPVRQMPKGTRSRKIFYIKTKQKRNKILQQDEHRWQQRR
jgi:hypothetical protein